LYLIDANIFLEVELGGENSPACEQFLKKLRNAEFEAIITDFIVDSIVIVMENYKKTWRDLRKFLGSILLFKGLKIHFLSIPDKIASTRHIERYGLDFDDATAYQAMEVHKIKEIVSYDEHFDKIRNIKRRTPQELLSR